MRRPALGASSSRHPATAPRRPLPAVAGTIRPRWAAPFAALLLLVATASPAHAATATYEVLLDLDRNAATGCVVPTPKGDVGGVEQSLLTTVTTDASGATVAGVARRVCSGGILGSPIPVDAGGWPVGLGNGQDGTAVVETYVPKSALGGSAGARVAVVSTGGGGADAIVAAAGAGPIEFAIAGVALQLASAIPTLSPFALVLLGVFVFAFAARFARAHRVFGLLLAFGIASAAAGLTWATSALLDGHAGDWTGVPPLATDAQGNAPPDADLVALFVQEDATRVHFRIDANVVADAAANQAPQVNAGGDQTVTLPASAALSGTASDDGLPNPPAALTLAWTVFSGPGGVTFSSPGAPSTSASFSQPGTYVLRLSASDGAISVSDDVQVTVSPAANVAPTANAGADQTITLPAAANLSGSAGDDGLPSPPGGVTIGWSQVSGPAAVTFGNATAAVTSASFPQDGVYVLRLTVSDGALSATDDVQVTVNPEGSAPLFLPSAIDPTAATTIFEGTKFLYSGPNPVQTGVLPDTIEPRRAAVLRGKVIDREGVPLAGVTVTVHARSAFGQTQTRADGRYDLAVNGGAVLTLNFAAPGRLPVHRTQYVPWRDYVNLPDVAMIAADAAVSAIAANAPAMQVHRGTPQTDASGTRRTTLLFPAGTGATMVLPGGATQPLASLDVRATEYTVGPNGPAAMPAPLPPTSAYTYAVELSVDQAIAAGARTVQFTQPVPVLVDNFLNFPAGTIVPAGVYDRDKAQWVAMPNGVVVKVVSVTGGAADLDVTGDGVADDPATALAPLGITGAERQALATLYAAGQTFWRTPTTHFSPVDYNWPYAPPSDARGAGTEGATTDESVDQCLDEAAGSIIECQNQILGQSVGVVGTPFTLNYRSDRVPGREIARTIDVAASGATVPASVKRIELKLSFAGKDVVESLAPAPNQRVRLVWDGKDAYGRDVQGRQTFGGTLDYVYDAVYTQPSQLGMAFAQFGGAPITGDASRMEFRFPQVLAGRVGIMDARGLGVGGWTLSPHHAYDPDGRVLYHGSGKRLSVGPIPYVTTVVAGSMTTYAVESDNQPATSFQLWAPSSGLAAGPDGSFYFVHECVVHRVRPDGILSVVAGTLAGEDHVCGYGGDGGAATTALLDDPTGLAIGPDGSLYVADTRNYRIRRIDPAGTIATIAGNGSEGFSGDGGLAVNASIDINGYDMAGVAVGADGSVYFVDIANDRIRRIDPAGIITTIAGGDPGNGPMGCEMFEGLPATQSCLFSLQGGIAVGPDGTVYFSMYSHVGAVRPDGTAAIVAGNQFSGGFAGDGGLARLARLDKPLALAVGPDGSLYIGDADNQRIRRVSPGGVITTFAGGGSDNNNEGGDGMPATQLELDGEDLMGIAVAPDHTVLATQGRVIRRFHPPLPDFLAAPINVASPDGGLLYQFDAFGRHLRTRHALTGAVLHEFGYDAAGRLASVTEKTGGTDNVTTIQRDASGHPTAIVAPFGQVTGLDVDANGYLSLIENPANEAFTATYTGGGLMETFTKPGNRTSAYQYEDDGRLKRAEDPVDGFQALARSVFATGHDVTRTTALGLSTRHIVEDLAVGTQRLTSVAPDGTQAVTELLADGTQVASMPGGMTASTLSSADPRFGMQAPFTSAATTRLPSALTMTEVGTRTAVLADPADVLSVVSLTDALSINNRTTTSAYVAATRTNVLTTPAGRSRTVVHDALGRVVGTQVAGLAPTSFAYDDRGRLSTVVHGTGSESRTLVIGYDAQGFAQSVTDSAGRSVQYTRDAIGRVTSKMQAGIGTVTTTYAAAGELATLSPPGRPAHAFSYDARGNYASVEPPLVPGSGPSTFSYDADGRLSTVTRPGGESVSFAYDAGGRLGSLDVTSIGLPATTYAYAYDAAGRPQSITGPGAQVVQHAYDGPLVTSTTWSGPFATSVAWTYDNTFRVATETVAGTPAIVYSYDADDLLTGVGSLAIGRNAQNGLVTSMALGTLAETYAYNLFGEPVGRTVTASGTTVYAVSYTRDESSRIVRKQETILGVTDTYDYAYDPIGQLLQVKRNDVVIEAYVYDPNGNRTSATAAGATTPATFDDQDRLLSSGATTFAHSAAGRRQGKSAVSGTTSYRYDSLGNLVDATTPAGVVVGYRHDGWDRLVQRLVGGAVVAQYVHAGDRIVAELDAGGAVVSRFVYAGARVPAYQVRGGTTYRLIADLNGSVRLVVDAATGAIAQRIDYDGFGRVVADTNPGFQPFAFAGGLYDGATGFVRFGARDYDPEAGRWTSKDPIGFGGGDSNLYRYAFNDPINLVDPSGLFSLGEVLDFAAGAHEAIAVEGLLHNPMQAIAVAVDGIARAAASALGYPPPGPSAYDAVARPDLTSPEMSMVDRSSDAYDWGSVAGALAPACIAAAGMAAGAGLSAAVQAGRNFMARHGPAAAAAREMAESIANRESRRAAQAAAEQWVNEQRNRVVAKGTGNGTQKLRNMDKLQGHVIKKP